MSENRKGKGCGEHNNMWKGGRRKHHIYWMIKKSGHPCASLDGYVYEHRLVMEEHLGRYLTENEIVHHISDELDKDGCKRNNIENLKLMTVSDHMKLHNIGNTNAKRKKG